MIYTLTILLFLTLKSSCFDYNATRTSDYLKGVQIYSTNYFDSFASSNPKACSDYCYANLTCRASTSNATTCFIYDTTDVILKQYSDITSWTSMIKIPLDHTILEDIWLNNEYRVIKSFCLTSCYEKCLKDSKCDAISFAYKVRFDASSTLNCYLYEKKQYVTYRGLYGARTIFRNDLQSFNRTPGVELTNVYKSLATFYEILCYIECNNDANCKAASFSQRSLQNNYNSDYDYYIDYFQDWNQTFDCFLSSDSTQLNPITNSTTYFKDETLSQTTKSTTTIQTTTTNPPICKQVTNSFHLLHSKYQLVLLMLLLVIFFHY